MADFSGFLDYTPTPDPESGLGGGFSADWMDFSQFDPSLSQDWLTPRDTLNQGAYRGETEYRNHNFDQQGFLSWLGKNNYTPKFQTYQGGFGNQGGQYRGIFNSKGQPVSPIQRVDNGSLNDNLMFSMGSMFLNPFGGIAAGGGAGGFGGTVSSGGTAQAINSAASGALHTAGQGGSLGDATKAAGAGYLAGGYTPDVAGSLGIENSLAGSTLNSAVRSGAQAGLSGGNVLQGAKMGGIQGFLSGLGAKDQYEEGGYSRAPWATGPSGEFGASFQPQQSTAPWASSSLQIEPEQERVTASNWGSQALGDFMDKLLPSTREGFGDMAQGLLGMYAGYRRNKAARDLMSRFGANRDSYASSLRGQLQARDARSGRRSNYSGRETELMGKLAELDSRNAPAMASLSDAKLGGLETMLSAGLRWGGKSGMFGDRYSTPPEQKIQPLPSMSTYMPSAPYVRDSYGSLQELFDAPRQIPRRY